MDHVGDEKRREVAAPPIAEGEPDDKSPVTPEEPTPPMLVGQEPPKKVDPLKKENAPKPDEGQLAGEVMETFKYMDEGKEKGGKRLLFKLELAPGVKMEFVRIPKGRFIMGAPHEEKDARTDEKPHPVEISRDFYLGKYEVTQAEYRAITGKSPSHFQGDDRLPVEQVSWDDAVAFCQDLKAKTGRKAVLPSEAQWEYACRAGTKTPFHFGSTLNGDRANCDGNYPSGTDLKGDYKKTTVKVGSYLANPWGLYDMHGNVYEWCQDCYGFYDKIKQEQDPIQLDKQSEDRRIVRGGSWGSSAGYCRAAFRDWESPVYRDDYVGFRVCLPLD